ncbi:histidine phosphatase family protein [Weissella fangxianensis]|uniref:histidine phosphatase family protein n=1 Tax=Weissella fangxianensis TaxID=2953879 RepID=UPI0021582A4F|nr:histidine phosphatase family protein [Weissella fangxianensis]
MTTFYFVRHGQTLANAAGLKQGQINSDITYLDDTGRRQVNELAKHFDISFADALVISPLHRTAQTADILNEVAGIPIRTDERVLEISYGEWDGKQNQQLIADFPDVFNPVLHDVTENYTKYAVTGETFSQVVNRINLFLNEETKQNPDGQIIVVTHGFTIKAVLMATFGMNQVTNNIPEPNNASVTKLKQTANGDRYLYYFNRN